MLFRSWQHSILHRIWPWRRLHSHNSHGGQGEVTACHSWWGGFLFLNENRYPHLFVFRSGQKLINMLICLFSKFLCGNNNLQVILKSAVGWLMFAVVGVLCTALGSCCFSFPNREMDTNILCKLLWRKIKKIKLETRSQPWVHEVCRWCWGIQSHLAAALWDLSLLKDDMEQIANRRMADWNILAPKLIIAAQLKGGEGKEDWERVDASGDVGK